MLKAKSNELGERRRETKEEREEGKRREGGGREEGRGGESEQQTQYFETSIYAH